MSHSTEADKRRTALSLEGAKVPPALATPFKLLRPGLERVTGLKAAADLYARIPEQLQDDAFFDWALRDLDVRFDVDPTELERIPETGPVLVVANHPFGALEGMALSILLRQRRPDFKILANHLLGRLTEVEDLFLFVDAFETGDSVKKNLRPMRLALQHLKEGKALATFPAGEVASWTMKRRAVSDRAWNPIVGRLAQAFDGPVIPIWFGGNNTLSFHLAGSIHPMLRTLLLPRQMFAQRGKRHPVRIGRAVVRRTINKLSSPQEVTDHLRQRVEILAERPAEPRAIQPRRVPMHAQPLIEPVDPLLMRDEIAALPESAKLVENDELVAYQATADQIPHVLREIGRLREETFRLVGEGTGRSIDTDAFDQRYTHLFIWNSDCFEVVGSYRIGRTDVQIARAGRKGLYTSTLFRMQPELFETIGPALEMGRSFIRQKYQRSFAGLLMLWKGIAEICSREPKYAVLFGPVSISSEYTTASQRLIVSFLEQNDHAHPAAKYVKPRFPFKPAPALSRRLKPVQLRDLGDVSTFIGEIEADGKGVPILLKQYLNLGGKLLGFNVDPDFSDVLDVLVAVDLREVPDKVLRKYFDAERLKSFRQYHQEQQRERKNVAASEF